MYFVEITGEAADQIAALPADALLPLAAVIDLIELAPWSGDAYNRERSEANMRALAFGPDDRGLAIYLVLDRARRVVLLRVLWAG